MNHSTCWEEKQPYVSDKNIEIIDCGPKDTFSPTLYIFSDVLEELMFNAQQRSSRGMLLGKVYRYPKKVENFVSDGDGLVDSNSKAFGAKIEAPWKPSIYIEIVAFKDIYPTDDALDYGTYLRRQRDFRVQNDEVLGVGSVCMTSKQRELTYEDLLFQRTYFGENYQIALFVSADGQEARVFMLDAFTHSFYEVGYKIVRLLDEEI